jgi:CheY-like chemotaxis protein
MKPLAILAVEDDDIDLMSLQRALRELRLVNPLVRAVDGVEAWEHFFDADGKSRTDCADIVLLDLNMPRMSGHEFLKKFHETDSRPDCKIFVMTTSDTDQDIVDAHKYDIEGYLLKSDIVESLREALVDLDQTWALIA